MSAPQTRRRRATAYGVAVVVLACVEPVLSQSADSHYILGGSVSVGALVIAVAVGLVTFAVGLALTRRTSIEGDRVAVVVAGLAFLFGHFGYWFRQPLASGPGVGAAVAAWALACVAGAAALAWLTRFAAFRSFVIWFLVLIVAMPASQLVWYRTKLWGREEVAVQEVGPPIDAVPEDRPNVYWIVLDELGRADALARQGIDVQPITSQLSGLGFTVEDRSLVSYARTGLSLGSTLSMDYVFLPGNDMRNEYVAAAPVVGEDNATFRRFRALGYTLAYLPAGVVPWSWCSATFDRCEEPAGLKPFVTDEAFYRLLDRTPITAPGLVDVATADLTMLPGQLREFRDDGSPVFVFAHVMSPHDPFEFTDGCARRPDYGWSISMTVAEGKAAYADEVSCLGADLVGALDEIVAQDPGAIIVVQGDHGSRFTVNWADPGAWTTDQLDERFANFMARRTPGCAVDAPEAAYAINVFRVVFACIEGRAPELLPYRAYLAGYDQMADMTDVTDRVVAAATSSPGG